MSLFKLRVRLSCNAPTLSLLFIFIFASFYGVTQPLRAILKGKVTDGSTGKTLFGVSVLNDSIATTTFAEGQYLLNISKGTHNITYKLPGFQTKIITSVKLQQGSATYLDVILFPVSESQRNSGKYSSGDSLNVGDSVLTFPFHKESRLSIYNPTRLPNAPFDAITSASILPGTDKNAAQLLKRLNGVVVQDHPANKNLQSLNIFGLGERYNQVLFNGGILPTFEPGSRAYPFELLPVEAIETVSVQKIANASMPADFAGGTVEIKTKDFPDQNFYYVQAGAGFSEDTRGKEFFSDKRGKMEWLSFPGSVRNLPSSFPTTRSRSGLNEKNPQEQVYLSKLLNNNLAPRSYGSSEPNTNFLAGGGKIIKFKKGQKLGIIAFINHRKSELIDESATQVSPDVANNPFPFSNASKILIRSSAKDVNYRYASHFTGIVNMSLSFGNNKISLKNFLGSQLANTLTQRSDVYKPGDDSLAHTGINYTTKQSRFWNTQLSGEHSLGANSKLKLSWLSSYTFHRQQNPDERNFLLLQDSIQKNAFEIARRNTPDDITSNGRGWKEYTDHNFTGLVNIQIPFNLVKHPQVISGGIYIENKYRVFFSDLFLTKGQGYFSLNDLLAPARYFPGGLGIENYFIKKDLSDLSLVTNEKFRGNYSASSNTGASYISLENRLTKSLSLNWGLRVESNTQLASNTQYEYFKGYKNPQLITIDKNIRVINFDFLPSLNINYQLVNNIQIKAAYFKTVNRPQLQELSKYRYYDALSFLVKTGNPLLANSTINNYDAGINWMPNGGTTISVSGFYKEIDRPIEYIITGYPEGNLQSTPHNTAPATIVGIEAAFKTKLDFIASVPWLSAISIFGNGNWLRSKVSAGPVKSNGTGDVEEHTLSGSPEYTVNTGLIVQVPRLPHLTMLYSRTGDYITALGSGERIALSNGNIISAIPDYRIKGRQQLDIQLSQQLFKSKVQIILGVNNLLSDAFVEYQDLDGNKKFDTPLALESRGNQGGFYQSGVDNTLSTVQSQRTYYLKFSYLFR